LEDVVELPNKDHLNKQRTYPRLDKSIPTRGENTPMKTCPECGSTDIIPDLLVFSGEAQVGQHPPYVCLVEPMPEKRPFIWTPKTVATGFRAEICGACGFTRFYTKYHTEISEAHKKGYTSMQFALKDTLPL
jgi:hypothetical protein